MIYYIITIRMYYDMWSYGKDRMASTLERLLEPPKPKLKWYHCLLCCYRDQQPSSENDILSMEEEK